MATHKSHLGCALVMSALAAATVLSDKAHAALITFNCSATVINDSAFGSEYPEVDNEDVVTGTLSYDLTATDSSSSEGIFTSPGGTSVVKVG